ncbi:LapA family protein [Candidatus Erwinia haradaeae]|uniref:Lipopolysaccharide assembly protein A n=1 Tax=Candidatus Erwinia haradaeae TaxID=1922217 RepID=A0A451DAI2_9GAMM|nr:lipopolysaccharide assembly protein LapA domain-containing protein [Candidatus Erwinia haradaeae]VFP83220.1 Lipopolysaccharide assembly protein A [Candidatus Erwinia haradaeae]
MKYFFIFLVIIVMLVLAMALGAHNDQVITFNYLMGRGEFHIATLLAVVFSMGFLLSWMICSIFWLRIRVSLVHAQRKAIRLQGQLAVKENAITISKNR